MFRHILNVGLEEKAGLFLLGFFIGLPCIGTSIDERSWLPFVVGTILWTCIVVISVVYFGIKSWRNERRFKKLTPEQQFMLLGDIVTQAQWDKEAEKELKNFWAAREKEKQTEDKVIDEFPEIPPEKRIISREAYEAAKKRLKQRLKNDSE